MARTHGRIKVEVWDAGSDFRHLGLDAQWTYAMLVSQRMVSLCGVLPYTPKKWAKLAPDITGERLEDALSELEAEWYIIVDRETDELLVRTMVKHDRAWTNPKLVTAARKRFVEIESDAIKDYLGKRHAWLTNGVMEPEEVREYEENRELAGPSERTMELGIERAID